MIDFNKNCIKLEGFPKQRSPPNGKSEDFDFVFNQIKLEHFLYVVQCCKKSCFTHITRSY